MGKYKVFIDGQEGTTGLRIRQMLEERQDLEVSLIPPDQRKDAARRAEFLNAADVAVLCLPDEAAAEAVAMVENPQTRLIDTSTARRIDPDWVYGLPEIGPQQREAVRQSKRVANCGCYPVTFILGIRPLIEAGLLTPTAPLTINAVSGYSGGGRKMIEAYQAEKASSSGDAALPLSLYGLEGKHKHLPEMHRFSLVESPPLFVPSVAQAYCGMLVSVPLPAAYFARTGITRQQVWEVWQQAYADEPFVHPVPPDETDRHMRGTSLDLEGCNFTNRLELFVFGDGAAGVVLVGRLDNLGKGAAGNAVQCLNLMLGAEETAGLVA
jgi:N-acetyl-gamma-glutamyl-phosphate reductase